jgi:hypothetical protein
LHRHAGSKICISNRSTGDGVEFVHWVLSGKAFESLLSCHSSAQLLLGAITILDCADRPFLVNVLLDATSQDSRVNW